MSPKATQFTKSGAPRKRAEGAGRKESGRTARLTVRILPGQRAILDEMVANTGKSLAEVTEMACDALAAEQAMKAGSP